MGLPQIPYFTVVYIILAIFAAHFVISQIKSLMLYGCGRHPAALVVERFSNTGDSIKKYFKEASATIDRYNTRITTANANMNVARELYQGMHNDICLISKQVDDGLNGNYVNNVPEDELKLPAADQATRKAKRMTSAAVHLVDLKKRFGKGYFKEGEDTPLIECFDDMSESEKSDIGYLRSQVLSDLNNLEGDMILAEGAFTTLRKEISEKQLQSYYVSLAFTDKNITALLKAQAGAEGFTGAEGFASASGPVLTFTPPRPAAVDPKAEPNIRLPKIADRLTVLERDIANLTSGLQIMVNTIALQNATLKKSKLVVNDADEQKRRLDAQFAKTSAPASTTG